MANAHDTLPETDATSARQRGRHGRYEVRGVLGAGGMGIVLEGYDPALQRPVAIKLLHPEVSADALGREAAERLIREARAMARLSHPNVVPVYEVGWSEERVFLAMELVDGVTLRAWLAKRPHASWREITTMFVAAGRGLTAAHDAGMVHRDFKPENVLIGPDGRPRVTDFGLVTEVQRAPDLVDVGASPLETRGPLAGTPAYMSPEQWNQLEVGPASDQFAFCIALWEALAGERPWSGTQVELRAAVCGGVLPERRRQVPAWLDAALRRGLAVDPARRWPALADLLDHLERRSRRSRRRWRWLAGAGALGAAVAFATAFFVIQRSPEPDPCPSPQARIEAVWSAARRGAIGARLGPQRDPTLALVDRHVESWRTMHGEACRATYVRGEQSGVLLDARMRCLDRRLSELDETLAVVSGAEGSEQLDHAVGAVFQLSSISDCSDADALTRALAIPVPPGKRREVDAIEQAVQRVDIDRRAERLEGIAARAEAAVADARRVDHPPTIAAALGLLAEVQLDLDLYTEAEKSLRELIKLAAATHDDRVEARAWNHLIFMIGYARRDTDAALALEPAAAAAVARAGAPLELHVEHQITLAQVLDEGPRVGEAITRLLDAKRLLDAANHGDAPARLVERRIDVLAELGNAYAVAGDLDASIAVQREALAGYRALWGPDTLDEAMVLTNLGDSMRRAGKSDEAAEVLREAARIVETKTGDSLRLAINLVQIGYALGEQEKWSDALVPTERALRIARAQVDPKDPALAPFVSANALVLGRLGRRAEARENYTAAFALYDAAEASVDLPIALVNAGDLELEAGNVAAAERAYARSVALFEQLRGPTASYLIYPLVGLGRAHVQARQLARARTVLERAVSITPDGADQGMALSARAWLGRTLTALGDHARGERMVGDARDALTKRSSSDPVARQALSIFDALP